MDGEKNSDTILHHCHLQHHIFINNNHHIQPQINKFQKFVEYVHVDLSLNKWALTGHPDNSNLNSITCKAYLQSNHITYKQHPFLALLQDELYIFGHTIESLPQIEWATTLQHRDNNQKEKNKVNYFTIGHHFRTKNKIYRHKCPWATLKHLNGEG